MPEEPKPDPTQDPPSDPPADDPPADDPPADDPPADDPPADDPPADDPPADDPPADDPPADDPPADGTPADPGPGSGGSGDGTPSSTDPAPDPATPDNTGTANSLGAASNDANNNFSPQPADTAVTPCAGGATPASTPAPAGGTSPPPPLAVPGNLEVTVTDSKTNQPIQGATVTISGPDSKNATTGESGKVKFNGIAAGPYTIKAAAPVHTTENGSATVVAAQTATAAIPLPPVTVTITLDKPVGCPGHPLKLTAAGAPAGGTYAWTITGAGLDLVDSSRAPIRTGDTVNLLGFSKDDSTGKILQMTGSVEVTYTFTNGEKATAKKDVKIHEIKFVVTNKGITKGFAQALERPSNLQIWTTATPEVSTDPKVEIQLDGSCPRKAECAANHRVGWLQVMLTNSRQARYSHTSVDVNCSMPIRDVWNASVFPFYSTVTPFTADRDKQTAHHEDSPSFPSAPGAPYTDPRAGAAVNPPPGPPPPTNLQLRNMTFSHTFTAWLVVQNIEWAAHDIPGSMAYQGNFDWSVQLNLGVDNTKAIGSRAAPQKQQSVAPAAIQDGKGGSSPNFANPIFNTTATLAVSAAAGI